MLTVSILWMLIFNNLYLVNYFILIMIAMICHSCFTITKLEYSQLLFNSYSSYDNLTLSILIISSIITLWLIYLNHYYQLKVKWINFKLNNEILTLILLLMVGMAGLTSSNTYLTLFVSIELQSLAIYIILATTIVPNVFNNTSKVSLSYLINAAMATALLLFGMSVNNSVLVLVAVVWKLGVVPVHVWSLPILDNQHSLIASIYLTLAKYGILISLAILASSNLVAIELLAYIGLLNLTLGNVLGLIQYRYQRIIVYSSLIQIGYISLIISNLTSLGLGYFELYSFYTVLLLILWTVPTYNLFNSSRLVSNVQLWAFVLILYTVAGLPFFPLFWTKLDILLNLKMESLTIAILSTLLSSFIYVRLIKYIGFFKLHLNLNNQFS